MIYFLFQLFRRVHRVKKPLCSIKQELHVNSSQAKFGSFPVSVARKSSSTTADSILKFFGGLSNLATSVSSVASGQNNSTFDTGKTRFSDQTLI